MRGRRFGLALLVLAPLLCASCRTTPRMELWYWNHSYLVTPESVEASKKLIDRAARAGYTGVVLWDSSWTFLSEPWWPAENTRKLKEVTDYAASRGLRVMPLVAPYGHSHDLLKSHPSWAEGQRVMGVRFRVNDAGRLTQMKSLRETVDTAPRPLLGRRLQVTPWRQFHIHFAVRTSGFHGLAQIEVSDGTANRLDANLQPKPDQDWTALDYTFNSQSSSTVRITAGAFGPHLGEILVDRFAIEETAFADVVQGAGTPLRVHGSNRPGEIVEMDYYAAEPFYGDGLSVCLTNPAVTRWMIRNARDALKLLPANSTLLLSHDEIRQMNSCQLCRSLHLSAGELLARHIGALTAELRPLGNLYIWSDMFDPAHNAHDHFYQVEGTVAGSWKGLPRDVTVINWNLDHLHNSLLWFSGDDPRQPVPHQQIIAGFYDPPDHDGAAAAHREFAAARGLPGIAGAMYTTWADDYSQLEAFGQAAREEWTKYSDSRPF